MMDLSWCWLFGLVLTHAAVYLLGRGDVKKTGELSEEAWIEVQKYEIDRKYALMAILDERSGKHEEDHV